MSPRLIPCLLLFACGPAEPAPAPHVCLDLDDGTFAPVAPPTQVFGAGLTYAAHLQETGQRRAHTPPIFAKTWSPTTSEVAIPSTQAMSEALELLDPGVSGALAERGTELVPLMDYEVELGLVLLDDYRPGQVPALGFFVANDLSERAEAVLGEGRDDRMAYWTRSKGHPGFSPTSEHMWVPDQPVANGLPCVDLETRVNGEVRQTRSTLDLVYTTTELLDAVAAEQGGRLDAGTWLLTGTPRGVAIATPAWKLKLADLAGLDRFQRLDAVLRRADDFLQPGDVVTVAADGLGSVEVTLVP